MKKKYKILYLLITGFILFLLIFSSSNSVTLKKNNQKEIITNSYEYISKEDYVKPEINLIGGEVEIRLGEEYFEPGYKALDNVDGDITSKVIISSNLDKNKVGSYEIIYSVEDSSNNRDEIKRIVKVLPNIKTYSNSFVANEEVKNKLLELNKYLSNYNVSVGYINLKNNFTYVYQENKVYFGASLIKTLDAMYVYEKNIIGNSIKESVKMAISKSDNNAHFDIVNYIGFNEIERYAMEIGGNKLSCRNNFCDTTVVDQLTYLNHLYQVIKNNSNGEELKSYFVNDYGNYLSFDYSFSNLHKYGNSGDYFHDVGIFDNENPYIIVVLTKEKGNGERYVADLIRHISSEINYINNMI